MSSHLETAERRLQSPLVNHPDQLGLEKHGNPELSPERIAQRFIDEIHQEWKSKAPNPNDLWSISGE
jgi:hypothetical protein